MCKKKSVERQVFTSPLYKRFFARQTVVITKPCYSKSIRRYQLQCRERKSFPLFTTFNEFPKGLIKARVDTKEKLISKGYFSPLQAFATPTLLGARQERSQPRDTYHIISNVLAPLLCLNTSRKYISSPPTPQEPYGSPPCGEQKGKNGIMAACRALAIKQLSGSHPPEVSAHRGGRGRPLTSL